MTGPSYFFLQLLLQIQALTQASPGLPETYHDVIVVGAGSAGLYATRTLQEYGYEVLLIEATDRIGGRVKSATLGDIRVELGAEEHYLGAGGNPVWPAKEPSMATAFIPMPTRGWRPIQWIKVLEPAGQRH